MGVDLLAAFGLVLVIEGALPLISPRAWRTTMQQIALLRDGQIRFVALAAVVTGSLLVAAA